MDRNNERPYQNVSLTNIKRELWTDVPGLEGYYALSNFGRIKRFPFEILCSNGHLRRMKVKIIRLELQKIPNQTMKDNVFFLRAKICRSGNFYNLSVARLVYYSFIKKFNLEDENLVVLAKDGDGKNINPKNLQLADLRAKQMRIYERNRLKRTFVYSFDEFKGGMKESSNPYCKQISQYSLKGKRIKIFPSIKAAAEALDIRTTAICAVLKERQVSCGGWVWRYGNEAVIDIRGFIEKRKNKRKMIVGLKLTQYSARGKRIASYLTIADAARASNVSAGDISYILSGKQKSAGGFIWRKGFGPRKIDLTGHLWGEELRASKLMKKVKQYSMDGKHIKTFSSIKDAAHAVGVSPGAISMALSQNKRSAGFKWKFA